MLVVGHIPSAEERRRARLLSRFLGLHISQLAANRPSEFLRDLAAANDDVWQSENPAAVPAAELNPAPVV